MSLATKSQLSRDEQVFHAPTQVGACHCQGMIRFDQAAKVRGCGSAISSRAYVAAKSQCAMLRSRSWYVTLRV